MIKQAGIQSSRKLKVAERFAVDRSAAGGEELLDALETWLGPGDSWIIIKMEKIGKAG